MPAKVKMPAEVLERYDAEGRWYIRDFILQMAARGWRMVPVEATEEMLTAATTYDKEDRTGIIREEAEACWSDMLAAAPKMVVE